MVAVTINSNDTSNTSVDLNDFEENIDDETRSLLMRERDDLAGITHAYLETSTLHGLRYT